ncbi:hypothetical protein F5148DRAFT_1148694 [Russula earlei]|uniref:Uncharacterized protein n=1 Tax=Russula earlei TaxID=71964 RepID=A0ACC0UC87_9AGAM|nr:hypothetical protein F5148DRAFT_1148694 [Russula earlei]
MSTSIAVLLPITAARQDNKDGECLGAEVRVDKARLEKVPTALKRGSRRTSGTVRRSKTFAFLKAVTDWHETCRTVGWSAVIVVFTKLLESKREARALMELPSCNVGDPDVDPFPMVGPGGIADSDQRRRDCEYFN